MLASRVTNSIFTETHLLETIHSFVYSYRMRVIALCGLAGFPAYLSHLRGLGAFALAGIKN
jgi:hypothetical protein